MSEVPFRDFETGATKWSCVLSLSDGVFIARMAGQENGRTEAVSADTWKGVRDKAAAKARERKVKLDIPFTVITGRGYRHGTVTGVHASTGNPMVTWDDGRKEQYANQINSTEFPRLTDEQVKQAVGIRDRLFRANAEWNDFTAKYGRSRHGFWRLSDVVKEAVKEASQE